MRPAVDKDTFVLRDLQEEGIGFFLERAQGRYWPAIRAGKRADSHAFAVRFVTRDGQPLELLYPEQVSVQISRKKKKRFWTSQIELFGECSYDMPMESGSGTILLEAVSLPEDKTVFSYARPASHKMRPFPRERAACRQTGTGISV